MSKKITIPTCMNPFKVTINGEKFIYPAGAEVEVPDEVAHIIECHENTLHKPIEEVNGGGSPEGGGASSGGKPNVKEKDVNFYDYDGTLLYSYSVEEAQLLKELPPLPTQPGLICQGWNWTLEEIKSFNRPTDIGAVYITDDGKTRVYISLVNDKYLSPTVQVQNWATKQDIAVDWGDGSDTQIIDGSSKNVTTSTKLSATHTYASPGDYVITFEPLGGEVFCLGHSQTLSGQCVRSGNVYYMTVKKVELGANARWGDYACHSMYALESVTMPLSESYYYSGPRNGTFQNCVSLRYIVLPKDRASTDDNCYDGCRALKKIITPIEGCNADYAVGVFNGCYNLQNIVLSEKTTVIQRQSFHYNYGLTNLMIPKSVTTIENNAIRSCESLQVLDLSQHEAVPTLGSSSAIYGIPSDCEIRVPAALYDEWIAATNWSTYANQIVGV